MKEFFICALLYHNNGKIYEKKKSIDSMEVGVKSAFLWLMTLKARAILELRRFS